MKGVMAGLLAALLLWAPAAAQPGAEAFVRQVYAGYTEAGGPDLDRDVFSPRLNALIRRGGDMEGARPGERGLGADPICDCQDWGRMRVLSVRVRPRGAGRADATVRFSNLGTVTSQTLRLVRGGGGWRVDDIVYRGVSLAAGLEETARREGR
jgi:hypothetical protein